MSDDLRERIAEIIHTADALIGGIGREHARKTADAVMEVIGPRLAAAERLAHAVAHAIADAGLCDYCYEDECTRAEDRCPCGGRCHRASGATAASARDALAAYEAAKEQR